VNPLPDFIERLKALFFRERQERELEEELRYHIARDAEARADAGSTDARREALATFGNLERLKDEVRAARGVLPLQEFVADTRYALRSLGRNAGFALTVVAVLGVGLGAATAVFTVVNRVLLTGLPYPAPDQLVRIYQKNSPTNMWSLSVVDVQAIAEQQRSF
jgi:putative ABC transport system permease protein